MPLDVGTLSPFVTTKISPDITRCPFGKGMTKMPLVENHCSRSSIFANDTEKMPPEVGDVVVWLCTGWNQASGSQPGPWKLSSLARSTQSLVFFVAPAPIRQPGCHPSWPAAPGLYVHSSGDGVFSVPLFLHLTGSGEVGRPPRLNGM